MKKYKVTCVVEVETEAKDENDALDKACVIADWANGDWQVEEIREGEVDWIDPNDYTWVEGYWIKKENN